MRVTRRLILQKARHQATGKPATPFDCLWARGFRYYFTPLNGVLFTFPSRYLFTIGRQEYLALDGGPPSFPHDRPSTWYSGGRSIGRTRLRLRGYHPLWPTLPGEFD